MESNVLNPTYKELIAMEKYRNGDTGRIYSNRNRNNWIKAIISVFAIAMLLGMMGVPIYNAVVALEDNAIPYQLGNSIEASTATGAHMGDILYYELTHFGVRPSAAALVSNIDGGLAGLDLTVLAYFVPLIADAIAASGSISIGSIADIILTTIAGISLGPISLAAIGTLASIIVGY
jgi:hypothetical protein